MTDAIMTLDEAAAFCKRSTMRFVELFAGAGGLSRGLEAAGMECVAHAEIEPHARAVLRHQWPGVRLDGDVSLINGADFEGIDMLSGGSPCQDMSVAGKRAGLGGSRSSLFHEQIRIWNESGATYMLWENVPGAFSSNAGADFAAVLSAFVGRDVPLRRDRWSRAGVVAGPAAVAAWRVLDLQHFGPPQRRARIFVLAARAGGVDPAEILALSESMCRHPSPREQSRESAAARAGGGAAGGVAGWSRQQVTSPTNRTKITEGMVPTLSGTSMEVMTIPLLEVGKRTGVSTTDVRAGIGIGNEGDPMFTLQAGAQHGVVMTVPKSIGFHLTQDRMSGRPRASMNRANATT
jgi:site-specific DNA-cytosine methylase